MIRHYLDYIKHAMLENWNAPAITDFESLCAYTYGELAAKMAEMNVMFEQLGLKAGDRIAICGRNSSNWGVAYLSVAAYKGIVVSILPEFTSESIYQLVSHSEARALLIGPWVRGRIELGNMPNIETFISIDDLCIIQAKNDVSIDKIRDIYKQRFPDEHSLREWVSNLPTDNMADVAVINYTSGSTGSPKGVMITHRNLSSNVTYGQDNIPNHAGWTVVSMLPLAHMFGLMFEFLYQLAGGTHVYFLTKSLTPALLMKAFKQVHPYMILTVPLVLEKIFKKQIFPIIEKPIIKVLWYMPLINITLRKKVYRSLMNAFGGNLQYIIVGGAALSEDVERCLKQIHFPYTCGYGMTECAPILCYEHWKKFAFRSCGKVVDRMEIKIDSDNPRKHEGEILVRGDNVMRGYYKNMEATDNIFTDDGWMRTGDIGIVDRKGNLFIKGRSKNMILGPSGQNIYPEEIEDKLNSMDGVAESIIVERNGKLIGLVFPDSLRDLDIEKIKMLMQENLQKLNKLLPGFSKVSDIELVDKEFEKTPKRSIKRFLYK